MRKPKDAQAQLASFFAPQPSERAASTVPPQPSEQAATAKSSGAIAPQQPGTGSRKRVAARPSKTTKKSGEVALETPAKRLRVTPEKNRLGASSAHKRGLAPIAPTLHFSQGPFSLCVCNRTSQ